MKITGKELRKLVMESANIGEPGQLGYPSRYGERISLEMVMDDYIETGDRNVFEQRVLDAMEKYVNMYNKDIPAEPKFKRYLLIPYEVMSATTAALSSFDPQTSGYVKDDHRFAKSRATDYPIDDLGNIKSPGLPDDMSMDAYERALVEDNVKNLHGLLTDSFNANLSVEPQGGSYHFIAYALSIPTSARGSLYFR